MAGHEPGAIARRDTRLLQGRPGVVLGEMALGFAIRQLLETHRRRIEPCAGDEPVKLGPSFTLQVDQQPGCRRATGKAVTPAADRHLQAYARASARASATSSGSRQEAAVWGAMVRYAT
jgi:hypothetical protein